MSDETTAQPAEFATLTIARLRIFSPCDEGLYTGLDAFGAGNRVDTPNDLLALLKASATIAEWTWTFDHVVETWGAMLRRGEPLIRSVVPEYSVAMAELCVALGRYPDPLRDDARPEDIVHGNLRNAYTAALAFSQFKNPSDILLQQIANGCECPMCTSMRMNSDQPERVADLEALFDDIALPIMEDFMGAWTCIWHQHAIVERRVVEYNGAAYQEARTRYLDYITERRQGIDRPFMPRPVLGDFSVGYSISLRLPDTLSTLSA